MNSAPNAHDPLTGLPDRAAAIVRIEGLLERLARDGAGFSVIFIDLDNFKAVNDVLGHRAGDDVIAQVARRLVGGVRQDDLVTRFGGDEFVLIMATDDATRVRGVARRAIRELRSPFSAGGRPTPRIGASAGIVTVDDASLDADEVIRRADAAMYQAKRTEPSSMAAWSPGLAERDQRRQELSDQLLNAMTRNELRIRYQPEVELTTGRILGYEGLLHWNHPVWGPLAMRDVLGAIREIELLQALAGHLVTSNPELVGKWTAAGKALRIDVHPAVLLDPGFARWLVELCQRVSIPTGLLRLEVDERALDNLGAEPNDAISLCTNMGVPLDLDRFGLGSASLRRLTRRDFSGLKLAPEVTRGILTEPADMAVVRAAAVAAEHLALGVVATGVDSPGRRAALLALGVRRAQGDAIGVALEHDPDGRVVAVSMPAPRPATNLSGRPTWEAASPERP